MKSIAVVPCKSDDISTDTTITCLVKSLRSSLSCPTDTVVLSKQSAKTTWNADTWFQGTDVHQLMTRFQRHRERQQKIQKNMHYIVIVDLLNTSPISPAYNRLFKDGQCHIITVSNRKDVIKDKRFNEVHWCQAHTDDGYEDVVVVAPRLQKTPWWKWW